MSAPEPGQTSDTFSSVQWYDRSINWSARLGREIPVLREVFGSPGDGGLLDAGCGTGRQVQALADCGYAVTGADMNEEMLAEAKRRIGATCPRARFICVAYGELCEETPGGFDGVYCLGNALAASGTEMGVRRALGRFGRCLRTGGRLFVQVLNFEPMKREVPCVRGPRVSKIDNQEYISLRQFHFSADAVQVTNMTMWYRDGWHQRAHCGSLYPVSLTQMQSWCPEAGVRIDETWSGYDRSAFDPNAATDLIIVGTKT